MRENVAYGTQEPMLAMMISVAYGPTSLSIEMMVVGVTRISCCMCTCLFYALLNIHVLLLRGIMYLRDRFNNGYY